MLEIFLSCINEIHIEAHYILAALTKYISKDILTTVGDLQMFFEQY